MEHEMAMLDEATLAAKEALHAHGIQRHALPLRLPLNARSFAGGVPLFNFSACRPLVEPCGHQ